ncbi:unnamed protein product [Meloidogyne enterolobii]|uniref:Uncharacterized protein n=1 Tax=Meloidogyne enterolobii TaxID=390850 RepID=A0ACB0YHN5_MELEN
MSSPRRTTSSLLIIRPTYVNGSSWIIIIFDSFFLHFRVRFLFFDNRRSILLSF